jgi:hypothetical protein
MKSTAEGEAKSKARSELTTRVENKIARKKK